MKLKSTVTGQENNNEHQYRMASEYKIVLVKFVLLEPMTHVYYFKSVQNK